MLFENKLLQAFGYVAVAWTQLVNYQSFLLRCATKIFAEDHTMHNMDGRVLVPPKKGRANK